MIEIKSYHLKNVIIKLDRTYNLKKPDLWKILLTIAINFISSKGNDEKSVMHLKSDKEIMINEKADEVIKRLFKSLLNRYQVRLEKLMKGSELVFDYVELFYYIS